MLPNQLYHVGEEGLVGSLLAKESSCLGSAHGLT